MVGVKFSFNILMVKSVFHFSGQADIQFHFKSDCPPQMGYFRPLVPKQERLIFGAYGIIALAAFSPPPIFIWASPAQAFLLHVYILLMQNGTCCYTKRP